MRPNSVFTPRSAFIVSLLAILLVPVSAVAQVDTGAIRGTVTDPSGAVVANAKVVLLNEATGLTLSATSGKDGTYTFEPVKIGSYTASVEAPGFKKATSRVTVNVQEQARADFKLVTGAVTETVEITAISPQLQTQDASVGTVATRDQINDLPLNGGNGRNSAPVEPAHRATRRQGAMQRFPQGCGWRPGPKGGPRLPAQAGVSLRVPAAAGPAPSASGRGLSY